MKQKASFLDRRSFLGAVTGTGILAGLAAKAAPASEKTPRSDADASGYDLSKFERTDPKLISHEQIARWKCPRDQARALAITHDDQLLIAAGKYVTVCDLNGRPETVYAVPELATCAATGPDGSIVVASRTNLYQFEPNGHLTKSWPSPAAKSWFTGLAVSERDIFVADSSNRLIWRFDHHGTVTARLGEKRAEKDAPGLAVPSPFLSVVIHPDGQLRVNNSGRHHVDTYSMDGKFAGAWGETTYSPHGFCGCCNPVAIAPIADGRIVTAEKGLPRVKIYDPEGRFESVVAGVETFPENARVTRGYQEGARGGLALAVDSRHRICILDFATNEIHVMQRKA